jgi:hypothetical protein
MFLTRQNFDTFGLNFPFPAEKRKNSCHVKFIDSRAGKSITAALNKKPPAACAGIDQRQVLQCKHLATRLWPHGNMVRDRMTLQVGHRIVIPGFQRKIVVLSIPLNQALALQRTTQAPDDGTGELREIVS